MSLDVVILAAGQGTRMRSSLPKVLHKVAGKSMLQHVIDAAQSLKPQSVQIVIGHGGSTVEQSLSGQDVNFVYQDKQLGTGHAVAQAMPRCQADYVLVLYGDVPLIEPCSLLDLLAKINQNTLALLTVELPDPTGYGRIVRNEQGKVTAIVEHKDASFAQLAITEGNTGILAAPRIDLARWLAKLSNNNAQGEYYLTDIIAMAVEDGLQVETKTIVDSMQVQGANDRKQLSELERYFQLKQASQLMQQGVSLADPNRFDLRGKATVGQDIFIDINVILEGDVQIEDNVCIGPNVVIKDSILRKGSVIKANSHLDGCEIGVNADCGPFARIRPGTVLAAGAHVGNFVELKNTFLGQDAKAGHLTYLGDSEIGARTNIGAGTITCNYDGANKHKTIMGEDVFIGSNSSLVAPVSIGNKATTGAGSTITSEVPEATLAVARSKQKNITNWARPVKS